MVETDFGLTVTYDWQSQVLVSVPSTYSNALCGLCGNYNGNREDEMMMTTMMQNNSATSSPATSGDHWKVMDIPGCTELSKVECPQRGQQQEEDSEMGCGLLHQADGPFGACHAHVDATTYFQSCVHDSCLFPQREEVACPIIARYAAACQAAGVPIGMWRTEDFCSKLGSAAGFGLHEWSGMSKGSPRPCGDEAERWESHPASRLVPSSVVQWPRTLLR